MLFNSLAYLFIFLPLVFCFCFFFKKKIIFLILSSLFFYSYFNFNYLFLIFFLTIINFIFGSFLLKNYNKKKIVLSLFILFNILILFIFKYSDFIIENINSIYNIKIKSLEIPFPLALSFQVFHQIIFLIDCFDNQIKKISFHKYFLFIVFFPQLIAGPITRYNNIVPQFSLLNLNKLNYKNLSLGIFLIIIGFFKKSFLADTLSNFVNFGFVNISNLSFYDAWILSICFTFQFYFDFSGYVDMALGSALLLNIRLPQNFNSPLRSKSIIEFWQKWHITLSNFLTNYVYVYFVRLMPRQNFIFSLIAILITFFIAGFWHGAGWKFVVFGLWHGVCICIVHIFRKTNYKIYNFLSWLLTFVVINIGFIFFRSDNLYSAFSLIKKLFNFEDINLSILNYFDKEIFLSNITSYSPNTFIMIMLISVVWIFFFKDTDYYVKNFKPKFKYLIILSIMFLLSLISLNSSNSFIYFNY
jgi:alginate O-acetyltransferase complex protein AlgI